MSAAKTATDDNNDDNNNNNNKNDEENDEDRKGDGEDNNEDEERKEDNENDNVRRGQMINRICGDSKDCAFGRQTNPANPCIIRSSLETLNMLPGESNGENTTHSRLMIAFYGLTKHNCDNNLIISQNRLSRQYNFTCGLCNYEIVN
ncbi:hypothetical protein ALC60_02866 [Trachymyrmex zeteki]|uniref:Uncharacterized protein n=1 Tax=Mycetomoellerius zeteki TaxID=64791 RepID=A0A151XCP2_9HYME|nr:hypothetical protein ALC60_02866 [Trachymyrmex zeteki]